MYICKYFYFLFFIFVFTPFLHVKPLVRLQSQSGHFYALVLANLVLFGCENFIFGQNNLAELSSMLTVLIFSCGSNLTQRHGFMSALGPGNISTCLYLWKNLLKSAPFFMGSVLNPVVAMPKAATLNATFSLKMFLRFVLN